MLSQVNIAIKSFVFLAPIVFGDSIDNADADPQFPRRTLITGAHRQFLLAPNLTSGGVAPCRSRPGRRVGRARRRRGCAAAHSAPPRHRATARTASLIVRAARWRHATRAHRHAMHPHRRQTPH